MGAGGGKEVLVRASLRSVLGVMGSAMVADFRV